jgi:hypothetical protein
MHGSVVDILPHSALHSFQLLCSHALSSSKITGRDFGINLNSRVRRNQRFRELYPFGDGDALANDGIVFHVAHAEHTIDFFDTKPVQDIRHQRLEAHVLDASNVFGALEVVGSAIGTPLPCVIYQVFSHFAQRSALFAEIYDYSAAAILSFLDRFFNAEEKIRSTGANVRPEDITSIALVVDSQRQADRIIRHFGGIAETVHSEATNGRQEDFNVAASNKLWVASTSMLKQRASQGSLVDPESLGNAGEVPDRFDRKLGDSELSKIIQADLAVRDASLSQDNF